VPSLRGKTIINLFIESSTRTRTSFEIAAKRLSADCINVIVGESSINKGETFIDTALTFEAMAPNVLVIRHKESGSARLLASVLKDISVINAGDGMHEHPTQALLDCLTLRQHFGDKIECGLTVAIVGDLLHSRVARSNLYAHKLLGNKVRLVGPPTLLPKHFAEENGFGFKGLSIHHNLREGLEGVDAVLCLRMQFERQEAYFIPSLREYSRLFTVTSAVLDECAHKAVLLHPGPVNRGIEVSGEVAYSDKRSLIQAQVTNGIATRMSVLFRATTGQKGFAV